MWARDNKSKFKAIYFNQWKQILIKTYFKTISIIDSKIKKIKNQNALSYGNNIRKILYLSDERSFTDSSSDDNEHDEEDEAEQMKNMGFDSNLADDTYLSMYFG